MLEIVRVVAVHPEANSVDVVFPVTGARLAGVQVLHGMAGADHGISGLAQPAEQFQADPFLATVDPAHAIYGVLAQARLPVLLGFLHPQVGQLMFPDKNRFTFRHPSDLYTTITDGADLEVAHPSGTFLRIAAAPAHEDLTGKDYDGKWKIARNTGAAPWLSLAIANAGAAPHTTLTIDPSGNVTFYNAGNVNWRTHGNLTLQVDGNLQATVNGTANVHVVGSTTVQADATLNLTVASTITSSAPTWNHTGNVNVTGTITATTDVIGAGTHLHTHVHSGVSTGASNTGAPV